MFVKIISLPFGWEALFKKLNIQRILAWSLCKVGTYNQREANPFPTSLLKIYDCRPANIFCLLMSHTMISDILADQQPWNWKRKGKKIQAISPCWYPSSHCLHELFTILIDDFGTKYICISSALTGRILICPSHNITPPVTLLSSAGIVDNPFKPIYFSVYKGISPIPDQSNGFLLLLHPSRQVFYKGEMWQNCGRGEETEQDWDSTLVGVKTRLNNSARTFFRGCRPRLAETTTMSLIFSVFSTKVRGFQGKCGHLKGRYFLDLLFLRPTYSLTELGSTSG